MRNFNKLANLHRVFFKRADRFNSYESGDKGQGKYKPSPPSGNTLGGPERAPKPQAPNLKAIDPKPNPIPNTIPKPETVHIPTEVSGKDPAWKSDRGNSPVRFGSDEPKRTALNTAHTPAPYVPPPDDFDAAYQSRLKQEFDDYTFANPFGERDLKSNRIFMNNRLGGILRAEGQRPEGQRPNGPGSDIRPPSEIEQRFTLPGHLKRPPFDKKDPTYGLE